MTNIKDSTSHSYTMYISTLDGYEELFDRLRNEGYSCDIVGNDREGMFIKVKERNGKDGSKYAR